MTTPMADGKNRPRPDVENRTRQLGRQLFDLARDEHEHLSALNRWTQQILQWCLTDHELKARVLQFIDVLPSLHTSRAVARHVREYFPSGDSRLPTALRVGASISRTGLLTAPALALVIRQMVERVSQQFIAGTSSDDAAEILSEFAANGVMVSFDVLGEQVLTETEATTYVAHYQTLMAQLSRASVGLEIPSSIPQDSPLVHLSVKPSALTPHFDPIYFEESLQHALKRVVPLAERAVKKGAMLTLDAEEYELRGLTLELAMRLLTHPELHGLRLGVVVQAYLRDAEVVIDKLISWLGTKNRSLNIRLVKGAYWDYEIAHARQNNWRIPVFQNKWQTDQMFERLSQKLIMAHPTVRTSIASHNLRSIARAMALAEQTGMAAPNLEFQLLYGMGEVIRKAIARLGFPVRIYAPVGELIPGMGYLVRRLLENSSNQSFLRQDLWEETSEETLLSSPSPS